MARGKDYLIPEIDASTAIDAASMAANFVPGALGNTASATLAFVQGDLESRRALDRMSKALGIGNLEQQAHHSSAVKKKIAQLRDNKWRSVAGAAGGIAGALGIGMAFAFTGPGGLLAGLAGGYAGGMLASKGYDKAFGIANADAIELVKQMYVAQQQGEHIPPEAVFAVLAANLPGQTGTMLEKSLEKETDRDGKPTKDFNVAFTGGHEKALKRMMAQYDTVIRANTGMLFDSANPAKTTAEQYAEWINSGQLDCRRLLFRQFGLPMQSLPACPAYAMGPDISVPSSIPGKPPVGIELK